TVVEEVNLAHNISVLRKALGQNSDENRFIVTVPGKGYGFVAEVTIPRGAPSQAPSTYELTRSRLVVEEESDESANPARTEASSKQLSIPLPGERKLRSRFSEALARRGVIVAAALAGAAIAIAVGLLASKSEPGKPPRLAQIKSIAVLP